MTSYDKELERIRKAMSPTDLDEVSFRPAYEEDIEYLREMLYPPEVVQFYELHEPSRWFEINGIVLNTVADMRGENDDAMPGEVLRQYGYVNVGSTATGDGYWLDLNGPPREARVVFADHDADLRSMSASQIRHMCVPMARSFRDFLKRFAESELPEDYHLHAMKKVTA